MVHFECCLCCLADLLTEKGVQILDPLALVRGILPTAETKAQKDSILPKCQRKYKVGQVDTFFTSTMGDAENGQQVALRAASQMAASTLASGYCIFPRFSLPPLDPFSLWFGDAATEVFSMDLHRTYYNLPYAGETLAVQSYTFHVETPHHFGLDVEEEFSGSDELPDLAQESDDSYDSDVSSASSQSYDDFEVVD